MSLEQAIQENTKAVLALIAAFLAQPKATGPVTSGTKSETPPSQPAPGALSTTKLVYKDVADPVTAYVKAHGKAEALKVLAPFKIERLTDAKEEQWPAILVAVTKAAADKEAANAKA